MISVTDLRQGITFTDGKRIYEVLSYSHTKLGRGTANIKVRVRDVESGNVSEKTFVSGSKVEPILLDIRQVQYLYSQGKNFIFMDKRSFEQYELSKKKVGDKGKFLKEGADVEIVFLKNEPLKVKLPIKIGFKVKETSPGIKGNTATNVWKEAILETGAKVKVPLFINIGDRVKIDTRTDEYVERIRD